MKIGLTGGIGSGKSMIARIVEALGFPVYISDTKASTLINRDENIKTKLIELFGKNIYQDNGELNKKELATIIFNNKEAIKQVNAIVHPAVIQDFQTWSTVQKSSLLFFESAILFESHLEYLFNYTILVTANIDTRIKRVIARDACNQEKVIERINNQMPDSIKQTKTNFVIFNNDDDQVIKQILSIIQQLNDIHSKQI